MGELAYWTYKYKWSETKITKEVYAEKLKMTLINNSASTVGGIAGSSGGAYIGAFIGTFCGGPVGAAIGATIGAIVGGIVASISATVVSNKAFSNKELVLM